MLMNNPLKRHPIQLHFGVESLLLVPVLLWQLDLLLRSISVSMGHTA